jgi:hypothetical protein
MEGDKKVVYLIVYAILFVMIPPIGRRCLGRRDGANNELGLKISEGRNQCTGQSGTQQPPDIW